MLQFLFFGPWENGMKWGWEVIFSANPDLADILGDRIFENRYFWYFFGIHISGFPGSQISKIWPGPGLGLGPGAYV